MNRRKFLALSTVGVVGAVGGTAYYQSSKPPKWPLAQRAGHPKSGFDGESTAESVTEGLDLTGKNILVTGCNSGMGYETMRVLAKHGAHVIGTGRTPEKADEACASVGGTTTPLVMELMDPESILKCAEDMLALGVPLDGLILNAGISGRPGKKLVHGIEKTFYVNYLGHFLFANKVLPAVEASRQGRIVHVSSSASYSRPTAEGIRFDALGQSDAGREYDGWEAYGVSKLANALFSRKLAKKYENSNVTSNALHPGLVNTNISRGMDWATRTGFQVLGPIIARTPGEGSATHCYCAAHPNMGNVSGEFLFDSNPVSIGGQNNLENDELADRLWAYSEDVFREYLA